MLEFRSADRTQTDHSMKELWMYFICVVFVLNLFPSEIDCTCTLPSSQWDGTWYDSLSSSITITYATQKVVGWPMQAYSSPVSSWICVMDDTTNNYLVFRGEQNVDLFGAPQNSYLCVKWHKVTDYSYYYYFMYKEEMNAAYVRVFIEDASIALSSDISKYCTSGPGTEEYHMMVKSGHEAASRQFVPLDLMGTFNYTYTSSSGATSCSSDSQWDVCTNRTTMSFDYTKCGTIVAFTQEGILNCVNYITDSAVSYVSALNTGSIDNTNYFRFTCFAVQMSGSTTEVSMTDGSCAKGQSPTVAPSGGGKATLTPDVLCRPCDPDPCQNGGTCTYAGVVYTCTCPTGYGGTNCDQIDPCTLSSPCQNGATCNNPSSNVYTCTCPTGYSGTDCENTLPCDLGTPCQNSGTCQPVGFNYTCGCATGYSGTNCELSDPCILTSPCQNGATCINPSSGTYTCTCVNGYSGTNCDNKLPCIIDLPCQNGGTCQPSGFTYTCACVSGYSDTNCTYKDSCIVDAPCQNGATCANPSSGTYTCSCASGYSGGDCESEIPCALSNPCQNGGTCQPSGLTYTCACASGYSDTNCTWEDPCTLISPCQNGATCNNPSSNMYTCTCPTGYSGTDCENTLPCDLGTPCQNGGTCQPVGFNYTCGCATGYSGTNCELSDPCILTSPCQNGATCINPSSGTYTCTCVNGYSGTDCDNKLPCIIDLPCQNGGTCQPSGFTYTCACASGYSDTNCTYKDSCIVDAPCQNGATCANPSSGTYTCSCASGYSGGDCESELPCALSNPCQNGGTCQPAGLTYTCACASGYSDTNCTWSDPCTLTTPCANSGTCTNTASGVYSCSCGSGYYGNDCQNTDPCILSSPCMNGATCSNPSSGSYSCTCSNGYSGRTCDTEIPCVLTNPCENGGSCQTSGSSYQCTCTTGYSGDNCTYSNPCQISSPCRNGASCSNPSSGSYSCSCVIGYYGTNCENKRACIFPLSWDSKWWDSQHDNDVMFTFSSSQISGWSVVVDSSTITSWTCVVEDTAQDLFVLKSDINVTLTGTTYSAFLCMKWTKVTDYSYYYYLHADTNSNANSFRVKLEDAATTQGDVTTYCSTSSSPNTEEFHMLVKQGYETSSKLTCASPFLGTFTYQYTDGSSTSCGTGSEWDVCSDNSMMTFNYSKCSTKVAFTQEGQLYCINTLTSGDLYYQSAINLGTVDNTNYFRFSCFAVKSQGSDVQTSVQHGSCERSQVATSVSAGGAIATLSAEVTCPQSSGSSTSGGETSVALGTVVGAAIGAMFLLALLATVVVLFKKFQDRKRNKQVDTTDNLAQKLPTPKAQTATHNIFFGKIPKKTALPPLSDAELLMLSLPNAQDLRSKPALHYFRQQQYSCLDNNSNTSVL
ncbi:neurogenic locus notch homolog protein 2-like isoform X2 [Pecten maximus]|uniref:neurogenic locus notch homolog protein 2-like isoform X2 n=1 Tax=Pecten maximus TaxID=6579 RepID=UPI0014591629|nr:neurogenic locus notch homolog protein 2-like isoform X2 [Pecten maximus]